jgi:hypothetical protein
MGSVRRRQLVAARARLVEPGAFNDEADDPFDDEAGNTTDEDGSEAEMHDEDEDEDGDD